MLKKDSRSSRGVASPEVTDWEAYYQRGETPWDIGEPAPGLIDFLLEQRTLRRGTVAVAGCGSGHDVRAWARAGFRACGYDLAPSAVSLARKITRKEGLPSMRVEFHQGDFLADTPSRRVDWFFEHVVLRH